MFTTLTKVMVSQGHHADLYPLVSTLRNNGKTYQAIADELNKAEVLTLTDKPWTRQLIHALFVSYGPNYNHALHLELVAGLELLMLAIQLKDQESEASENIKDNVVQLKTGA